MESIKYDLYSKKEKIIESKEIKSITLQDLLQIIKDKSKSVVEKQNYRFASIVNYSNQKINFQVAMDNEFCELVVNNWKVHPEVISKEEELKIIYIRDRNDKNFPKKVQDSIKELEQHLSNL